jgi:hypothetical protein
MCDAPRHLEGNRIVKKAVWIGLAVFLGAAGLWPRAAAAEDFRVEASVNATKIGLDDDLQLTVSIYGDSLGRASAPALPKHEGFRLAGQSQSTSIQWINGQMSATRAIVYRFTPLTEGKHTIDPIVVTYQGKEYLTEPIEVEVVSGSVQPRAGGRSSRGSPDPFDQLKPQRRRGQQTGEIFVEAELSRPSVYVGEQVVLTYNLYTQMAIMGLEVDKQPKLTGFWVEDVQMPKEPQWKETTVEGKKFYVFEIKKSILFPTKPGKATIEPATFSMAVRASSDPFDSFFLRTTDTVRRSSKPVTLDVKPLPLDGKPRNFSGAVGQFKLEAKLDREEIAAGEPLTLDIILEGQGNLKTVEVPELPTPNGFRTYDPKTEEKYRAGDSGFGGEKRWEYVLVPSTAGRYQLGPLDFAYFDPARKAYVELKAGPLRLDVETATAVAGATVAAPRSEVKLLRRDVRYLKAAPDELGVAKKPFYRSGLFIATLTLPMLWNLGLVAYRWKREHEASRGDLWRRRRARKEAHGRLKLAAKRAHSEAQDFYEVTATALYRYVGDKLGVSPSGLTTQQIASMLEQRQVPAEARAEFRKAVEACEYARFTPGERTRKEMEALLAEAEQAIVTLEKHLE